MMRVTCSTIKAGNSNGSEGRKHGEYNQSYQDVLSEVCGQQVMSQEMLLTMQGKVSVFCLTMSTTVTKIP